MSLIRFIQSATGSSLSLWCSHEYSTPPNGTTAADAVPMAKTASRAMMHPAHNRAPAIFICQHTFYTWRYLETD